MSVSLFGGVRERTSEENDLYKKIKESGLLKNKKDPKRDYLIHDLCFIFPCLEAATVERARNSIYTYS